MKTDPSVPAAYNLHWTCDTYTSLHITIKPLIFGYPDVFLLLDFASCDYISGYIIPGYGLVIHKVWLLDFVNCGYVYGYLTRYIPGFGVVLCGHLQTPLFVFLVFAVMWLRDWELSWNVNLFLFKLQDVNNIFHVKVCT